MNLKQHACIFSKNWMPNNDDEPPDGNVAVMVGYMLPKPKSNDFGTKQIHMVNWM
jgi:hypothetical protein